MLLKTSINTQNEIKRSPKIRVKFTDLALTGIAHIVEDKGFTKK